MIKFQNLFAVLNEESVQYLVVGGIAVNLYGIERATADIDLVVDLEEGNVKRFVNALKKMGLKPKVPVALDDFADADKRKSWIEEKGMMVFNLYDPQNSFFEFDVFVEVPFDFKKVFDAREEMTAGGVVIPVVPLDQLIEMKEKAGRPQDRADVYHLKKIIDEWKDE